MPGKKKKFIDKKNAVTFHLVHRSQRDPLQAADDVPQRVLLPAAVGQKPDAKTKEELYKYGIFFDDDYDYMQHLRDANELYNVEPVETFRVTTKAKETENPSIKLPSTVFGSTAETDVGLLNKAAPEPGPKPDWDPDIVAALDEDFDFDDPDNQLEDDFVVLANQPDGEYRENCGEGEIFEEDDEDIYRPVKPSRNGNEENDDNDVSSEFGEFDGSDEGSFGERTFNDMETKSRFTEYSMTSSVVPRSEGLTLLDDRFEKFYEKYDDDEIGALDHDEITGYVKPDSEILAHIIEDFEKQQQPQKLKNVVEKDWDVVQMISEEEEEAEEGDEDDLVKLVVKPPKEKWDCESILSTYSTLYNHPQLIKEPKNKPIKLTKRVGIPADALPAPGPTRKQLEQAQIISIEHANTYRPRKETAEERRLRKQAVKEERRMRREQKKANKLAFKSEKIRQERELHNLKQNIHGLSLT